MGVNVNMDRIESVQVVDMGHETLLKFKSYGANALYEPYDSRVTAQLNEVVLRQLHADLTARLERMDMPMPSCASPACYQAQRAHERRYMDPRR